MPERRRVGAQAHHVSDDDDGGGAHTALGGLRGDRGEGSDGDALACTEAVLDDRDGAVRAALAAGEDDAECASVPTPISSTTVWSRPPLSAAIWSWAVATVKLVATPRCVSGMPASAGTDTALVTPGTTRTSIPASWHANSSSPPRPKT